MTRDGSQRHKKRNQYNSYRKIQQDATVYQNLLIHDLYEAQHVLCDTAHHQEPKTVLAASGFKYVFGCRLQLRFLSSR
jgi:hypothetical protein